MNYHNVVFEASYGLSSQLPPSELPEIAFAGRSNVGKSSMINRLFNRRRLARVSATPGKTATINFFRLDGIRFVDLPGYGYAKVSKGEKQRWAGLMEEYFDGSRSMELVFQLVDMRHPPSRDDLQMIDFLIQQEIPFVIILTKKDKLSRREQAERLDGLKTEIPYADQITMIPFSAETGEGLDEIKGIIDEIAKEIIEEEKRIDEDTELL